MEFIIGLILAGGFFLLIIVFVLYLLGAIGLYKLADNKGIDYSFLAFIPILQSYIIGKIIADLEIFNIKVPNPAIALPVAPIIASILTPIPVMGLLAIVSVIILNIAALHKLYKIYVGDSATLYTVLSVVLPFLQPILIFTIRNKQPKHISLI